LQRPARGIYLHSILCARTGGAFAENMAILSEILEFSTERLTSFEIPRKRAMVLLRWTLFGTLLGFGTAAPGDVLGTLLVDLSLAALLIANLAVTFLPLTSISSASFEFALNLLDAAIVTFVVFQAESSGLLCIFLFLLLISTAGSTRIYQILMAPVALSGLYFLFLGIRGNEKLFAMEHLMVFPLFYAVGLHFGYQVLQIRASRVQVGMVYRERQELRIVLKIMDSITSSLDFHAVMYEIASRIADAVDAARCSIVLVEEEGKRAFVVAANDDRKLKMLPVNLDKYPEIQAAIRRKKAVIIEDIETSDLMRPYVEELLRLNFRSLLVLPIVYQETVIGTLFLRASRKRCFTDQELKFCRVVASAAASAIKNSMLYRSLEEKVREQQDAGARTRALFDNSPDLILQIDSDGMIREANQTVERLSGRSRQELLAMEVNSLLEGLPPVSELTGLALPGSEPRRYDGRLGSRHVALSVGPLGTGPGSLMLIGRDVTEQKEAAVLMQQTEKLSSIGEIVASVAHELNNPLSGVLGFSQLLSQRDKEGLFRRDIERIVECADRCQKIVQNLLSFSRPAHPEKKPVGINGILEKTLDLLEPTLKTENIEIVKELDPRLPYILGDFHQVQQVFTNLITNAQQAMSSRPTPGRLVLRSRAEAGKVILEVADNGAGIPPEVLPRIFDPFFSTKKMGSGTGLGLSVSYGIIREHGGELRVETRVGQGTTFQAIFPVHCAGEARPAREAPAPHAGDAGKEILVVDDEEIIVELYLQLLQALGHKIDTASTGLEALKKIEVRDYDLVITDIKMPKMSGIQLYEKVASLKPSMRKRFIFITGDMNSLTSQQMSTVTDNPCLLKPVNIEKIESTIHQLLSGTPVRG
jgi:PAS domain S-box-containing protein